MNQVGYKLGVRDEEDWRKSAEASAHEGKRSKNSSFLLPIFYPQFITHSF